MTYDLFDTHAFIMISGWFIILFDFISFSLLYEYIYCMFIHLCM